MTPGADGRGAAPGLRAASGGSGRSSSITRSCSTFDSSPEVGSIGRAIDIGQADLRVAVRPAGRRRPDPAPLLPVRQPVRDGRRRDLPPRPPPDDEPPPGHADGRGRPARPPRAADVEDDRPDGHPPPVGAARPRSIAGSRRCWRAGPDVVLFDVLDEPRLAEVGRLIWVAPPGDRPLFAVGSSGLEYALTAHWRASGPLPEPGPFRPPGPVEAIAVVSGSCSPATRRPDRAGRGTHGFAVIEVDAGRLVDPERADRGAAAGRSARRSRPSERGRSVVVCSAVAPDDPRIAETAGRWERAGAAAARDARAHRRPTGPSPPRAARRDAAPPGRGGGGRHFGPCRPPARDRGP